MDCTLQPVLHDHQTFLSPSALLIALSKAGARRRAAPSDPLSAIDKINIHLYRQSTNFRVMCRRPLLGHFIVL